MVHYSQTRSMHIHTEMPWSVSKVGIASLLPIAKVDDVKWDHQLLTSIKDDGLAQIKDKYGNMLKVNVTKAMVMQAFKLPQGVHSLV